MANTICEVPPFIFTHIPKTGGTSLFSKRSPVANTLRPYCKGLKVMGGHKYLRYLGWKIDLGNYFKFSIVRNPYDRFISLWKVKMADRTLSEFISEIKAKKVPWYPLKQQVTWIWDYDQVLLTDHLIRFEDYEEGINQVFHKLGLPSVKLPHLRKTQRKEDYRPYYTNDSQIEFVTNYYKFDLKHLNYSF